MQGVLLIYSKKIFLLEYLPYDSVEIWQTTSAIFYNSTMLLLIHISTTKI